MRTIFPYFVMGLLVLTFTIPAHAQVTLKTGSIFGKVVDDQGTPLPGVTVTLESSQIPTQTATSLTNGAFRFANLPPATYSVNFSMEGFAEVRQEEVRVSVGATVELDIKMKASLTEEFTVIGETPVVDTTKAENESTYNRDYLNQVPSGRDPWVILDQTPGIDNDRYNVAGSESGQQSSFFSRGASDLQNTWNYDGVNATDPVSLGASPTYYDFDAFEEIQVTSGGSDPSVQTSGVQVNIVTKRGGNQWAVNTSGYFTNHSLQSNNTPQELADQGDRSNRINEIYEYGLDAGGPVIKDKFFVWGAYRRQQIDLITITNLPDNTELNDYNFKANLNPSKNTEFQFGYFNGVKNKDGRGFDPPVQSAETLWSQGVPGTILNGLWTGQGTWIPNDKLIVTGRYGYIGNSFSLIPAGGKNVPMIYLAAIPLFEDTSYYVSPIDRPSNDWNADLNYYKENFLGGDHEFKFGFEYKTNSGHTFSSYGNGLFIVDTGQTDPSGPLTSGYLYVQHFIDGNVNSDRASFYVSDTYRKDRLTLNLGVRMDYQNGKSEASSIPGAPGGFDTFVGPLEYTGNDLSPSFTDFAPRIGATYDLTGDGKTVLRGNYARYYDPYNAAVLDNFSNPTYVYNGAYFAYTNTNGDRTVTPEEATFLFNYGGWLGNPFNQAAYEANRLYADNLSNSKADEFVIGFEREIAQNTSFSVNYTYRKYSNFYVNAGVNGGAGGVPVGVTADDFVPGGVFTGNTVLGTFSVPYMIYAGAGDGTLQIMKNIDGYEQTYNGLDFIFQKRMSNNFMLNSSLSLQDQKANYSGGDSFFVTTGDGLTGVVMGDPSAVNTFYNDQPYAFVSTASGKSGVFPFAEWTFRASGVYQLPWELSVGAFARYQQGYPYVIFGTVTDTSLSGYYGTSTRRLLVEPIGERRYDNLFTMDVNVQKMFDINSAGRITVSAGLFNLFNANTVVQRNRSIVSDTFNDIQETISGRALRLGLQYSF
jgi:Carboxypeptidase regulatory-like domain